MDLDKYEFLKGFKSRMNIIGSISSFIIKLVNSQRFKDILDQYELINLSVAVLCYLLEKTFTKEGITILHIKDYILWVVNECYGKELSEEDALELSRFLIRDVFMNSGEYYSFNVFDFEKGRMDKEKFQLVKDKLLDDDELIYLLTGTGNDFMIRTKEIDQHLNISMQQIIAKEFIKRKDFKNAYAIARDLLLAIRKEKHIVGNYIDRIRTTDVIALDIDEYKKRLEGIFRTLEGQHSEMEDIIRLTEQAEEEFVKLSTYDVKMGELRKVKDVLIKVKKEQISLLSDRYAIDDAYEEALRNAMSFGLDRRFGFQETIIDVMKDNPELLEYVPELLRPLYKLDVPKHYNLFRAYESQQVLKPESKEKPDGVDLTIDEDTILKKNEKKKEVYERYFESLRYIIDEGMKRDSEEVSLKELIDNMDDRQKDYFICSDDEKVFFKIVTFLFTGRTIYIEEVIEKGKSDMENITIPSLLKHLYEFQDKYKKVLSINVYKDFDSEVFEVSGTGTVSSEGKKYSVDRRYSVTNYKFKVVCSE